MKNIIKVNIKKVFIKLNGNSIFLQFLYTF
jgi:hypothetical protein